LAVHFKSGLFQQLNPIVAEVQVYEAAEVAEGGGCDQLQLVVGQLQHFQDGGEGLKVARLDVSDIVVGQIQGPEVTFGQEVNS
jgi:hypothetical protein